MSEAALPRTDSRAMRARLMDLLGELGSVVVAYSGGVDSSFLLWAAAEALGPNRVVAVTGDSPTLPRRELEEARRFASGLKVAHLVIPTRELDSPAFVANPPDRCFHCKDELFGRLEDVAAERGAGCILDGTNADDCRGHRPGTVAARIHGVRSPLAEVGMGKETVRQLSREAGLPTWDKPQMACLASRFPHGHPITREQLARVEDAEMLLRDLGLGNVRVRDHDGLARIEIDADRIEDLSAEQRATIAARLRVLGFRYITLDLEGFRSGSLSP